MHKNTLWQGFLVIVFLVTLWYSAIAGYRYYNYSILSRHSPIDSIQWEVLEISEENYILKASYTFQVNSTKYSGVTSWPKESYRNTFAAYQALKEFAALPRNVWYNPHNPANSSLQKSFPLKECISALVLWGILLYFLWLGFYVSKFKV